MQTVVHPPLGRDGSACSPRPPPPHRCCSDTSPRASQRSPSTLGSKSKRYPSKSPDRSLSCSLHTHLPNAKAKTRAVADAPSSSTTAQKRQSETRYGCVYRRSRRGPVLLTDPTWIRDQGTRNRQRVSSARRMQRDRQYLLSLLQEVISDFGQPFVSSICIRR